MKISSLNMNILWAFAGVLCLLILSTIIVFILNRVKAGSDFTSLNLRIRSWWIMAAVFAIAMMLNRVISICFFAFISFLALKEYLSLIPTRKADRRVLFWAYLSIPLQYYWIGIEWYGMFIIFIPLYMFLLLPINMVIVGETTGFLHAAGTLHWGLMTTVFSLSHAAFLLVLPVGRNPNGGGAGLLLFLAFLTQLNDVSQYLWGKLFGRHKVIPRVSPNKTWEGLVGGVSTSIILAGLIGPWLTPFDMRDSLLIGAIIGLAGFFGDVTISSLKRDLDIKDSGNMIPGHGGILDRVDSLTYTAPLFFHFTYYFYY